MANSTVYKIVKVRNGKKMSAVVSPHSKYCLTYEVGKPTVPAIGKLFAFDSIENAKYFAGYGCEIWKASGENASKPSPLRWRLVTDVLGKNIQAFWDRWLAKTEETGRFPSRQMYPTPKGTVGCDSIILKKQV